MDPAPRTPPPRAVARLLQLALAATAVVYGVIGMVLRGREGLPVLPSNVHVALHVLAGLLALGGIVWFRRVDAARRPREGVPPRGRPGIELPPAMPLAVAGWALFEAVGILGLVSTLGGGTGQVLILASLLLILLHPPRDEWFAGGPGA